jgi:xanthine dehydrogenase YagR molybdenum-binding subunit
MVKIASDVSGIPIGKIRFELGKSNLPPSPGQGGSVTVASVGSAVYDVCNEIKQKLFDIAIETIGGPYKEAKLDDVFLINGKMGIKGTPSSLVTFADLMEKKNINAVEATKTSSSGEDGSKYAFYSFGAHFAEVYVHKYTGAVRVTRFVSCVDAGRIINEKTASSQISGAVVMGIGMALMEEQHMDHQHGRLVANDFAGYHIPVQADVPNIEVIFVDKADPYLNKMGAKGLGEIGLIGAAAAIGNAVFHATGKRIRSLPITPDKLV